MGQSTLPIRVLHVDDNPEFAELVAEFLEREDDHLTVQTVTSASEGVDRLTEDSVDCVVSDYDMPGRNGIEFLETVRETHPDLPFVLFTGKGSEEVASEAISAGVTEYLQKESGTDQYAILANRIRNAVESRRAQQEVKHRERELRRIIDNLPHSLYVVDTDGRFVVVNETHARLHDTTVEALEGRNVDDILENGFCEQFWTDFREVVDTGEPTRRSEVEFTDPTGETHILDAQLLPYDSADTDKRTALGIAVDITERKKRTEMLRRYETLVEEMEDGVFMVDADGEYVFVNETAAQPYSPDKWIGRSVSALANLGIVDDDVAAEHQAAIEPILTGEQERAEHVMTVSPPHVDDDVILETRFSDVTTDDGEILGAVGTIRDVTERLERERKLRTFQEAVENAGHAMYWTDADGTIEYVNPAFEDQTGYGADDVVGEPMEVLNSKTHSDSFYENIGKTLRDGEQWEGELVNRGKNGERYTVHLTISPVFDDDGIDRFVAVSADVTSRDHRKQQLAVLQRVLRHDLRNNLNEIVLAVQLIERRTADDAVHDHLDAIKGTVDETLSLSQDINDVREIFETDGESIKQVVDIAERIRSHVSTIRTERPDVDIAVDLPDEARVVSNELIDRAIRNVLQNAIEHNDAETPEIDITLRRRPETDEVAVRIADNGPGIPDEEIEVLTSEREDQLHHLSGFGLWLVQWVASLSGGDLTFDDNDPRGTAVSLVLPAATTPPPQAGT